MPDPTLSPFPEPPQARFSRNRVTDTSRCSMYFLAGAGLIKIGITTNLSSRLRAIRNSSPVPLETLAIIPRMGNVEEGMMHSRFRHLRRHGEWFEDDGSIREHIRHHIERYNSEQLK